MFLAVEALTMRKKPAQVALAGLCVGDAGHVTFPPCVCACVCVCVRVCGVICV